MRERVRDPLQEPLTLEYFLHRMAQGWKPLAIEWERSTGAAPEETRETWKEEIPYGFRVSDDALYLEQNPEEVRALLVILEEIVKDRRFSQIADELNRQLLRTRAGAKWTSAAVFDLLPEAH